MKPSKLKVDSMVVYTLLKKLKINIMDLKIENRNFWKSIKPSKYQGLFLKMAVKYLLGLTIIMITHLEATVSGYTKLGKRVVIYLSRVNCVKGEISMTTCSKSIR